MVQSEVEKKAWFWKLGERKSSERSKRTYERQATSSSKHICQGADHLNILAKGEATNYKPATVVQREMHLTRHKGIFLNNNIHWYGLIKVCLMHCILTLNMLI